MATDTTPKQTDTKSAESPKSATPAKSVTATKSSESTQAKPKTKSSAKPAASTQAKPKTKSSAKTAAKPRTRSTSTSSSSRSRAASKSRSRRPGTHATRTEAAAAAAPGNNAKVVEGGQQFVAAVIDAQEKTMAAFVTYQSRAAELYRIPGATGVVEAQATVLRNVTDGYVNAARAFLK